MNKSVIEVRVRALIPTGSGCAVFLGTEHKVFVIYVDPSVGSAIGMFINGQQKERPLTHDLMALLLEAVGAKVERIVINDLKNGTYFGRLILSAENEIQQRKIIELDARPSDCIAMAAQQHAPIYVCEDVWNEVEDMTEVLEKIEQTRESESDEEG
jgi:bifunctional DNase/RNase